MANHTPTAAGHDQTAAPGTVIALTTLFTYSDADGAADIVGFSVSDHTTGGGYLTLNGVKQADNTVFGNSTFGIPIGQIGQWAYVVGPAGSADNVAFNAIDSQGAFNPSVTATVTAQAANHTPTAAGHDQTAAPGTVIALTTLFTYSDADGAADIVGFSVSDHTTGGGYLTLNGVKQADNTVFGNSTFGISIGQIGQWAYVVGPAGSADNVAFNAIDSQGAFNPSVTATVTAQAANHTPTAAGNDQTAAPGTVIALTTLFTYSDADGAADIVGFSVSDHTTGGGYLTLNGVKQADNTVFGNSTFGIPIGQIGQWAYVVGPAGSADNVAFNAIDSQGAFNPSVTATVTAQAANHTPTAAGHDQTAAPGTVIALTTLFTYSDADGAADIVGFSVSDHTTGGGYLTLNGVKQADNTVFGNSTFGIPIGQIGQWAYVVGLAGSADNVAFNAIDSQGAFNPSVTATVTAGSADVVLDTTGTAYGLTINGTISNTIDPTPMAGSANTSFDHDWFAVNLTSGHSYTFSAHGTSGTLNDVAIDLRDSSNAIVDPSGVVESGVGGTATFNYTASGTATYYLAISAGGSYYLTATGGYSISADDNSTIVSNDGVHQGPTTTTSLAAGQTLPGTIDAEPLTSDLAISLPDGTGGYVDKDWYQVTLAKTNVYTFAGANVSMGTGLIDISLYGPNGTRVVAPVEGANPSFTFDTSYQSSATQTYYLAVSAGGPDPTWLTATGNYTVSLSVQGSPSTPDQIPGSIATQATLTEGQTLVGTIDPTDVNGGVDDDYYRVSLNGGSTYTFIASSGVSSTDTLDSVIIRLRDVNGNVLLPDETNSGSNPSFSYTVPGSGTQTYYLAISASTVGSTNGVAASAMTGQYSVSFVDPPNSGPSNSATSATDSLGTPVAGVDLSLFPGPDVMSWLRNPQNTNLSWVGYYLYPAPSRNVDHGAGNWTGHYMELASEGWHIAAIYVGEQDPAHPDQAFDSYNPSFTYHSPTLGAITKGTADGNSDEVNHAGLPNSAVALLSADNFPKGSIVYLDIETVGPSTERVSAEELNYISDWCAAVAAGNYTPGVYCQAADYSTIYAAISGEEPNTKFWIRNDTNLSPAAPNYPTNAPSGSGILKASAWQYDIGTSISTPYGSKAVDLDTAIMLPSAVASADSPQDAPVNGDGGLVAYQAGSNTAGTTATVEAHGSLGTVVDTLTGDIIAAFSNATKFLFDGGLHDDVVKILSLASEGITNHTAYFNGNDGNDQLDGSRADTSIVAAGGNGNDTLIGGPLDDVFDGGPGNDTLTGGGGADSFVLAPGDNADTITDLLASDRDKIDLSGFAAVRSLPELQALTTQVGSDTVIDFGNGDTLTLLGVAANTLMASEFVFATTPTPLALSLAVASDQGTQGDTMTVAGTGEAGDQVTVLDGATVAGTGTVDGAGNWSIMTAALAGGSHLLTVSESDAGSVASIPSIALQFTISAGTPNSLTFFGTPGIDSFTGGAGNDYFKYSAADLAAADTVKGADGTDRLYVTTAGTVAAGGVGGVEIYYLANGGANSLSLANANFAGVTGASIVVYGGNAGNTVNASALSAPNRAVMVGGAGKDVLTGGAGGDAFDFTVGNLTAADTVAGGAGADALYVTTPGAAAIGGVGGVEVYRLANGGANSLTLSDANFAGVNNSTITVYGGDSGNTIVAALPAADKVVLRGAAGADNFKLSGPTLANAVATGGLGTDRLYVTTAGTAAVGGVGGVEIYYLANGGANSLSLANANFAGVSNSSIVVYGGNAGNTVNASALSAPNRAVMVGGAGKDLFTGGAGGDAFDFTAANLSASDAVAGGAGADVLYVTTPGAAAVGGVGGVEVYRLANGGANSLSLSDANFAGVNNSTITVYGGDSGNTIVAALPAADKVVLRGAAGADNFKLSGPTLATAVAMGGLGTDRLYVTTAGTVAAGGVGGVEIYYLANGGANSLSLANANFAGVTNSSIVVYGGNAGNTVNASALSAPNRAVMVGGAGKDLFTGGAGGDAFDFTVANLAASDAVAGGAGGDVLYVTTPGAAAIGGVGGVEVYRLANGGANSLTLSNANFAGVNNSTITVYGGDSGNQISEAGVAATDKVVLKGGVGADTLIAGQNAGMTGGTGTDVFVFTTPGSLATPDTNSISDFIHASDKIALSNAGFGLGLAGANAAPQPLPASLFSPQSNGSFTTAAQRFSYNSTSGALSYDADGSGAGASRLIATLTTHPTLAITDLFFVA